MKSTVILAIVIVMVLILKEVARNPAHKGAAGENRVSNILNSLPKDYLSINNVIISSQTGTAQIDHIVVSPYGIFVIETKNYSGWIYGTENSEHWKESFRTTGAKSFRNPIRQNWGHIYALSDFLNLDKRAFRPIVVFSDHANLHITTTTPVVYMSQLKGQILNYTQELIPSREVETIYSRIKTANLVGTGEEERHVERVKEDLARKESLRRQGKCPRCGGNLVLRDGKYGKFFGCSNYPNCKYTQKL